MFDKVFGHERIKTTLSNMVANDQLHHGLLFAGPDGIGKRLTAKCLAKAMMCEKQSACGSCTHCRKMDKGTHPDFLEIAPEGLDIKVDQIRHISENLHYRPFEGPVRFTILDNADRMAEAAANAFLKSLEEPPSYMYFVLVTAEANNILPTIRSRCQRVSFQGLTQEDKHHILSDRFGKDETTAKKLAGISFRKLETEQEALEQFAQNTALGLNYLKLTLEATHAMDLLTDSLRDKANRSLFLDHLMSLVREMTFISLGREPSHLYEEWASQMEALASKADPSHWRSFYEDIVRVETQRRRNLNMPLWFNAASVTSLSMLEKAQKQFIDRIRK